MDFFVPHGSEKKKVPGRKVRFRGWREVLGLGGDFKDVFANFAP